jgi:protein-disulfide isomerase
MTLKDRLTETLNALPEENTRRAEILRAILAAEGDGGDGELEAAIGRMIDALETKAAGYDKGGHATEAKAEREEIKTLQTLLGIAATPAPAKKSALSFLTGRQQRIAGVAVLAVAAAGLFVWQPWNRGEEESAATAAKAKVAVFDDDRTLGDPKAPIVLLEYAAPTCPFCGRFALTGLPGLKRDFIDTGKVFFIFRTYPLQAADGAVEGIARCLPKERYFSYLDHMYREQPQWDPDGYIIPDVPAAILKVSAVTGLGPEKLKQCMSDMRQQERTNEIAQDAMAKYQIEGTPTFIMDGEMVNVPPGKDTADVLRLRINSLLALKNR